MREQSPFATSVAVSDLDERYRALVDYCPDAICVHGGADLVYVNPAGVRLVGADTADSVIGKSLADFVHPDHVRGLISRIRRLDHLGATSEPTELTIIRLDGVEVPVQAVSVLTMWEGSEAYQVILRDLTAQKEAEAATRRAERLFTSVVTGLVEGVIITSRDGTVQSWNPAAATVTGVSEAEMSTITLPQLARRLQVRDIDGRVLDYDELPHVRARTSGAPVSFTIGVTSPNGEHKWLAGRCRFLDDSDNSPFVLSLNDVTAAREASVRLEYQATHDSLTGLPNRLHVVNAIRAIIEKPERDCDFAVLFLDLDNLKSVNDSRGHSFGDDVLRMVACRLRSVVDENSLVGRVGGDEFVAVVADALDVERTSAAVHEALAQPIDIDGRVVTVSASIGSLVVPRDDRRTINDLLRDADLAMYQAKAAGGNRTQPFTPQLRERVLGE
ncbi:diguanylate cyclase domain-containing protein [Williamsia sp. CHRR-6]|uniref:diguanylate cyclase domain-containing protein n=1 Tax=Williamsia sp. CHRR-6 TaxID=2835871 RepID=UPI001BDA07AF|nr:diguanylate cyclase [Williamsia sp. CHRR-6]MBT0566222.1 diguanylate cyclase [Williamsia sp. CHRR-6]